VLDVACGAGASAIPAARAVGPGGHVLALDAAEPMLALGRDRARSEGLAGLEFGRADMTELELPPRSFHAVVCVFGLFFVPDMAGQAARLWSLVAPGGRLAITVLGPRFLAPMIDAFAQAAAAERPDVPLVLPWARTAEADTLAGVLAEAGVPGAAIEHERRAVALATPDDWWQAVMGSGLRRHVDAIGPAAAGRVRDHNARWMAERDVHEVEVVALYALAARSA
jgi:SAM-dependent methyltransferase